MASKFTSRRHRRAVLCMATIPVITFGLGTWQIQRLRQKQELLAQINDRMHIVPVELPASAEDCKKKKYTRVEVSGVYDHKREQTLLPRMSQEQHVPGALIVTPLRRNDNGQSILVTRGWVPMEKRDPATRLEGQLEGQVKFDAIIGGGERGSWWTPANRPHNQEWYWFDLPNMARHCDTEPIMVEATKEATPPRGLPLGGQTFVNIRNEHMQYIVTWYSLSAITAFMTYRFWRR